MYSLKPIHSVENVEVPNCMYHMKNLHTDVKEMADPNISDPDMQALEGKEKKIAEALRLLSEEVKQLSVKLGHNFGESIPVTSEVKVVLAPNRELPDGISDFVISISPGKPAWSAILIAELLTHFGTHVATPTQKHSSLIENIPEHLLAVTGGLSGRIQHHVEKVVMTFIWKDDPFCPSLMHLTAMQTRIMGDANIARYLCRILFPMLYDESNIDAVALIDKWIDTSLQMTYGNSKEKDAALKSMNSHLGRNDFCCDQKLSLADVTLLASLLNCIETFKSLPKNVKKWFSIVSTNYFVNTIGKFNIPESWIAQ